MIKGAYKLFKCFYVIGFITLLFLATYYNCFSQDNDLQNNKILAKNAADHFLQRYRETLDVKVIFEEMGSSYTIPELRSNKFFEDFGFDSKFVQNIDEKSLKNAYQVIMNTYYVGMLFNLQQKNSLNQNEGNMLPKEISSVYKKSRFGKLMNPTDADEDKKVFIKNKTDLQEYIRVNNQVHTIFKKYLLKNPFESATYKKNFEASTITRNQEVIVIPSIGFKSSSLKNSAIFSVQREFFTIYFVKEKGKMKIFIFGLGN